uniref:Recombinase n=1 Tax=Cyanothece sp. (strain PCC 7425 / ATCC 29141) TaxID=395961 RepID=B8HV36_CYAP4
MRTTAYTYSDLIWETPPPASIWGWEVDQIYQDFEPQRPQLQQLIQDCQRQPTDYLLLRRLEELGDSVAQVCDRLAELEALSLCILVLEQDYQSSSPSLPTACKPRQLLELLNTVEAQQRSRKIRRGHGQNRLKSLPPPGKPPYGYRRGKDRYVLDRPAASVVKDFIEYFLLYGSLRGAVRYLEQKHSKKISVSTGKRWLTSPVYRGDLVYENQQVVRGTHAAILPREEAAQVDRLLRRNRSLPSRSASAPRSLAGLVSCAHCQSPLRVSQTTTHRGERSYLYLRPTTCPQKPRCPGIPYQAVLEATIQLICAELPQAVTGVNLPALAEIKSEVEQNLAQREQAIEQLPQLVQQGILDQETAMLRTYKLRGEIAQLQDRLAQLPPLNLKQIAQTISIPQFWLDLSEAERRFYFREFLRQVQIVPHPAPQWSLRLIFIF